MIAWKQRRCALDAVWLAVAVAFSANAQTNDHEQLVLTAIDAASEHICSIKSELSGEGSKQKDTVESEWENLTKQLASLGINVQGQPSAERLAIFPHVENKVDCKTQTSNKIVERLLEEAPQVEVLLVLQCDRLASSPYDTTRPMNMPGVEFNHIDTANAIPACRNALREHPNDIRVAYQLGRSLQKDGNSSAMAEAARLYKMAADQGVAGAQTNLGNLYESGLGGLEKNEQEAVRLYRLAADQNMALAQFNLGRSYEMGRGGLAKSDGEAARLYKLAADQGLSAAQYNLGRFYENGRFYEKGWSVLAKNDQEAARLFKLAADQGYAPAQYSLGRFYEEGRGGLAQNDREAARLYQLAADQGYDAEDQPMRVVVVRSSRPDCEPKCAEWISAEGAIVLATAEQLRKVVSSLGGRKLPILIHSPGGASDKAMAIGFFIRQRGLDVAVGRTAFDKCANAPGGCNHGTWSGPLGEPSSQRASCYSACNFVLAGGVRRFVGPEARVGVHNFNYHTAAVEKLRRTYRGKKPFDTVIETSFPPFVVAYARTYYRKLGLSEDIENLAVSTPVSDIRILTEAELLNLRLATDVKSGHDLVYPY